MQTHDSNLRPSVREHFTDNTPTSRFSALLARIDWRMVYPYATNALALGFVGFYAYDFSTIAANGNHIYTIYRLFPLLAATAICIAMWTLPKDSLLRVFYLAGSFTVSWLV